MSSSYGHPGGGPGSTDECQHSIGDLAYAMYFKVLAFLEPNRLTSKAKAKIISGGDDAVTSEAAWCRHALNGNGSVLAFCEAVCWRSAFASRCWVTPEAAWDSCAFNGDGQCWLSLRLLCRATSARRSQCDVALLPRQHGTATLSMVMVILVLV